MVFLLAVVLGVVVGWLRRGSLLNLGELPFRFLWLGVIAFGLRLLANRGTEWMGLSDVGAGWLLAGSYLLFFAAFFVNRRLPGMGLLAAGAILNVIVILANGGRMPVSPAGVVATLGQEALRDLAESGDPIYSLVTAETRLPFLADVFYLPPALGLTKVFSVGDILVWVAIFHLVQSGMRRRWSA